MSGRAIHQFALSVSFGDGISNGMLFTQRLLRAAGITSQIYAVDVDPALSEQVLPHTAFAPSTGADTEAPVLLVHHGIGCPVEDWLAALPAVKVLVFHNITPAHFFAADDPIQPMLAEGWAQLQRWREWLSGAIADSQTNLDVLLDYGYAPERCAVIPLLVDLQALRQRLPVAQARPLDEPFRLLFVGRLIEHKHQLGLVEMLHHLRQMSGTAVSLELVGSGTEAYISRVQARVRALGLEHAVRLRGRLSEAALAQAFAQADLYVSCSQHEGFGMPLVEAMAQQLPVVACAGEHSHVAQTLGEAGLVVNSNDPQSLAAAVASLMERPLLRRALVQAGQRALAAYEPAQLYAQLHALLRKVVPGWSQPLQPLQALQALQAEPAAAPQSAVLRIEGPFESSYSLAIVNRELGLALHAQQRAVVLHASEGPGDYTPAAAAVVAQGPTVAALHGAAQTVHQAAAVLRLMYPLRLGGANSSTVVASCYGWEESRLPAATVAEINRHAQLVTTMSDYVSAVLRSNGVRVPVVTVGLGAEHILRVKPDASTLPRALQAQPQDAFTLLHVSSCFPRKGVDLLLAAYAQAFSDGEPVQLVIKTFPNPHHRIEAELAQWRAGAPQAAPVTLINADLEDSALRALYQRAQVLVAPSRGEGFGLPLAEAMLHGVPVVTTGFGGQRQFCNEQTAWLVDYRFVQAQTHLSEGQSAWAEAEVDALAAQLRSLYVAHASGEWEAHTAARRQAAQALIQREYSWARVAQRVEGALAALDTLPAVARRPRLGCVSSWNSACGIATYSRLLLEPALGDCLIFANRNATLTAADEAQVQRCWSSGSSAGGDDLTELGDALLAAGVEQVLIQFNFAFFELHALRRLLGRLQAEGVRCWLFCHSTADVDHGGELKSLRALLPEALALERVLVHGIEDLNQLKRAGLAERGALFPHGVRYRPPVEPAEPALREQLAGCRVIASYGFLLPHKGIQALIRAFAALRDTVPDAHLLLVNARYPAPVSLVELASCEQLIAELGLEQQVTLLSEFLPDAVSLGLLELAELLVFPYQATQESSSAAVRWGLSLDKPVYCTPLPIFADVADAVAFLPGTDEEALCAGLVRALLEGDARAEARGAWLRAHDWRVVSQRLADMVAAAALPLTWADLG